MEATSANIAARSKRQAMDWSLVLASQDIGTVIEHTADDGGWWLIVDAQDEERARAAIRQYRIENHGWAWRQNLRWPGVSFHWGGAVWCLLLVFFHAFNLYTGSLLQNAGMMDGALVRSGQWWRLVTATTLHADWDHLFSNAGVGMLVLGLAMARFGAGFGLLAALLAGVMGNVGGLLIYPEPFHGLGASGVVMGAIGLLTAESVALLRQSYKAGRYILGCALGGLMLFVLLGLDPNADVVAHAGGFVTGVALGVVLSLLPTRFTHSDKANLAASALLAGIMIYCWKLALTVPPPA